MDVKGSDMLPQDYCMMRIDRWGEFAHVRVEYQGCVMAEGIGNTIGEALIAAGSLMRGIPLVPEGVHKVCGFDPQQLLDLRSKEEPPPLPRV